jgi:hypothetical protein
MQTNLDHIEGEFGNLVRHGAVDAADCPVVDDGVADLGIAVIPNGLSCHLPRAFAAAVRTSLVSFGQVLPIQRPSDGNHTTSSVLR